MPVNSIIIFISLLLFACSHSPYHTESPVEQKLERNTSVNKKGHRIAEEAKAMLGKPYQYGGASPSGFDCSGLVFYTHNKLGIRTPRTSLQQFKNAKTIQSSRLSAGDLVFFKLNKHSVSHVGIYIGGGRFVHAPQSGKRVSVNRLNDEFWKPRYMGAGRYY